MVEKKDIDELERNYYAKIGQPIPANIPEPTVSSISIPTIQSPTMQPPIAQPLKEPIIIEAPKPPQSTQETVAQKPKRKTFDDIIEDIAEKKKQQWIEQAYNSMTAHLTEIGNAQPQLTQLPQQPQSPPVQQPTFQPQRSEVQLKQDATDEYQLIMAQLVDPKITNKWVLVQRKRELEGNKPYTVKELRERGFLPQDSEATPNKDVKKNIGGDQQPKLEKNYSLKFSLAVFGAVLMCALGVGYAILSGII